MEQKILRRVAFSSIFVLLALFLYLQFHLLDMPMVAPNSWREAQTFAVARNLVEESFDVFHPRYDWRGLSDGQRGGEFPLYNAAVATVLQNSENFSLKVARAVSLFFAALSMLLIYFIVQKLTGPHPQASFCGWFAVVLYETNAILSSLSISIQPEVLSFFLTLLSVFVFLYIKSPRMKHLLVLLVVTAACLVKPSAYAVVAFFVIYSWFQDVRQSRFLYIIKSTSLFAIPLGATLLWGRYTMATDTVIYPEYFPELIQLTHLYQRGVKDFIQDFSFDTVFHATKKSLIHGFNIAGIIIGFVTVFMRMKRKQKPLSPLTVDRNVIALMAWVFLSYAFLLYSGGVQRDQNHYAGPLAIPAILLTTVMIARFSVRSMYQWSMLAFLLQAACGVYYLDRYYLHLQPKWAKASWDMFFPEKFVNTFSTRNDLFMELNLEGNYDPSGLGQIQRRGMVYISVEEVMKHKKEYPILFFRSGPIDPLQSPLFKKTIELVGEPTFTFAGYYFFDLRSVAKTL